MRLIDDFFCVLESRITESGFAATIRLNPEHVVYTGHFPGFPVTPGVVQLQIVQELLERHLGHPLRLKTMSQAKFLKILNPRETDVITVTVACAEKDGFPLVHARGEGDSEVYFKMQAVYQPKSP